MQKLVVVLTTCALWLTAYLGDSCGTIMDGGSMANFSTEGWPLDEAPHLREQGKPELSQHRPAGPHANMPVGNAIHGQARLHPWDLGMRLPWPPPVPRAAINPLASPPGGKLRPACRSPEVHQGAGKAARVSDSSSMPLCPIGGRCMPAGAKCACAGIHPHTRLGPA